MKPRVMHITIKLGADQEPEEAAAFAYIALLRWGGQYHPDDPFFGGVEVKKMSTSAARYEVVGDDILIHPNVT